MVCFSLQRNDDFNRIVIFSCSFGTDDRLNEHFIVCSLIRCLVEDLHLLVNLSLSSIQAVILSQLAVSWLCNSVHKVHSLKSYNEVSIMTLWVLFWLQHMFWRYHQLAERFVLNADSLYIQVFAHTWTSIDILISTCRCRPSFGTYRRLFAHPFDNTGIVCSLMLAQKFQGRLSSCCCLVQLAF